jgi:hypothetical protein
MDRTLHADLTDDNVRWAIARKIILRVFETCDKDKLIDLVVHWNAKFMGVINENFPINYGDQLDFYHLVKEKSFVMAFYEVVYRRLNVD